MGRLIYICMIDSGEINWFWTTPWTNVWNETVKQGLIIIFKNMYSRWQKGETKFRTMNKRRQIQAVDGFNYRSIVLRDYGIMAHIYECV